MLSTSSVGESFLFNGKVLKYDPGDSERAIELPIARAFLEEHPGRTLEFGDVLHHAPDPAWLAWRADAIVDKYERDYNPSCVWVTNVDIVDYAPYRPFDTVVSISTLEHVGYPRIQEGEEKWPEKVDIALRKLLSYLTPDGHILITFPWSVNPHLDEEVVKEAWDGFKPYYLLKTSHHPPAWRQATLEEIRKVGDNTPLPCVNAIVVLTR